jgi:hypothetical protein
MTTTTQNDASVWNGQLTTQLRTFTENIKKRRRLPTLRGRFYTSAITTRDKLGPFVRRDGVTHTKKKERLRVGAKEKKKTRPTTWQTKEDLNILTIITYVPQVCVGFQQIKRSSCWSHDPSILMLDVTNWKSLLCEPIQKMLNLFI